jgi:hypothetical protein
LLWSLANVHRPAPVDRTLNVEHVSRAPLQKQEPWQPVHAPLPLRNAPVHRETLPSFLSRLAAVNGVGAADFAVDLGFSIKRFLNLEEDAVRALAGAGGLDATAVAELLSWTGTGVGDVRMEFRSELFVSRALRNPRMRGCPVCLRADAQGQERTPARAMALRGDWQLREVSLCVRHDHPLVTLWEVGTPAQRYDVAARLNDVAERVLAGGFDAEPVTPSPYDLWLDARLEDGRDTTWLAGQSLYAATTFCRLLGAELLRLEERPDGDPAARQRKAQAVGFAVARHGPEAIEAALDRLAGWADGARDGPNKAFGRLFQKLSQDYREEPAFAPFRKLLRDRILKVWPIAPGTDLLGEVVTKRSLHSVVTAAQEAGIGTALMEQMLIEAGAVNADDRRPAARKTFAAEPHAALIAEIPTLIGSTTLRKAMGANQNEFEALVADGVLAPRAHGVQAAWRLRDGLDLVAEVQARATRLVAGATGWESTQVARARSGLGLEEILGAIRDGRLQVGQQAGSDGWRSFRVRKAEIDRMARPRGAPTERGMIPAGAVARDVGLRDGGHFLALLAAGHSPAQRMKHPRTGVERLYMSPEDIAAFHRRFLTLRTMATEFGTARRGAVFTRLHAAGVRRFAPGGVDHGPIWLRAEVEAALR